MKAFLLALLLLQFAPRVPLSPAETLLEPELLRAINEQTVEPTARGTAIMGTDRTAGDILVTCPMTCDMAVQAIGKLGALISTKTIPAPQRSIHLTSMYSSAYFERTKAAIHLVQSNEPGLHVFRGFWSTAGIGDEVAELFARHSGPTVVSAYRNVAQQPLDPYGIPTTAIMADVPNGSRAAFVTAATAYFLATLPNSGAEALLSHLTVGAHARLAEDGRKAMAQMGTQQRAGADVLIMFGQAIEREQRRMRSFERFMPEPVDPMLRSRIADMEKGITSVWSSMGLTSSPFVPAAQRIRGRGGEDTRVPARIKPGRIAPVDSPTAFLKFDSPADILYELHNFIDGSRSISDIRDAVSAEFGPLPLPSVTDYFDRLARTGAISIR